MFSEENLTKQKIHEIPNNPLNSFKVINSVVLILFILDKCTLAVISLTFFKVPMIHLSDISQYFCRN